MTFNEDTKQLVQFLSTLVALVLLSKIGGTGADLAIMTGLIGILGMLARPTRERTREQSTGTVDNPTIVEGAGPDAEPVPTREG
jgi:hypothetical protein